MGARTRDKVNQNTRALVPGDLKSCSDSTTTYPRKRPPPTQPDPANREWRRKAPRWIIVSFRRAGTTLDASGPKAHIRPVCAPSAGWRIAKFQTAPLHRRHTKNIVARVYPNVDLERTTTEKMTFAEMLERLNEKLSSSLRPRGENVDRVRQIVTEYSDLWLCLAEYVDFSRAQIHEYSLTSPLDGFSKRGLTGNFAFVIIDEQTRQILFFCGGDCD